MFAVIFEVVPSAEGQNEYLQTAAALREHLTGVPGFISIERFQSLSDPAKLLSLSFWEDEKAIAQWRNLEEHRLAQAKGRGSLFADYRIRVAQVMRDYSMLERQQTPGDSKATSSLSDYLG